MEDKSDIGIVINKYNASNLDTKKITRILCNIIDLLMVFAFEDKN